MSIEELLHTFPGTGVASHPGDPDVLSLKATENIGRAGGCNHPVRLTGSVNVTAGDRAVESWSTDSLPGQELYVACKTRKASQCPSCARIYQGDAYQLIVAGLRGGKNTPEAVASHPALFVTLTAPSFGEVHAHRKNPKNRSKIGQCRPRRGGEQCPHGKSLVCWARHDKDDYKVGQPFCTQCFDYEGAVMWNAHAPALWRVTRTNIDRRIAAILGVPARKAKEHFRTQYVKVAEFQARGLVHFHIALRIDGSTIEDDAPLTSAQLDQAVREAVALSTIEGSSNERISWGRQGLDVKEIEADIDAEVSRTRAAGYLGKYSTKGSDGGGVLDRRFLHLDERRVKALPVNNHLKRLVWTAWQLGEVNPGLRCDAWAHQFGYRGHFMTKSRAWSTTFAALRKVRSDRHEEVRVASWQAVNPGSPIAVTAEWQFAGVGYQSQRHANFAEQIRKHKTDQAARPAA